MDDDDGMESFEINDTDLQHALNPGQRRYQSKNDAIYGVFNPNDSDEEEEGGHRGFGFKQRRGGVGANYAAPVSFVSGGIKVGEKIIDERKKEEPKVVDEAFIRKPKPPKQKKNAAGANVMAGLRTSASRSAVDPTKFADFLKHDKDNKIQKMMEKMGYNWGGALGASGEGIVEPVQAAVRAGRGAVGAYGKEATGPKFGETAAETQRRIAGESGAGGAEEEAEPVIPKGSWKKAQKVKTRFKTIDQVIEEGGTIPARLAKTNIKVIDMTGREQKVYRGYDSFTLKTRVDVEDDERENFDVPELRHNLNLLLDLTEENIRRSNNQIKTLKDQSTAMEYDITQLKTVLIDEENEAARMKEVYGLIERFSSSAKRPTMLECQNLFVRLGADFPHEYNLFGLETVAIPVVLPLIKDFFSSWQPLNKDHEDYGIDMLKEWKSVLVGDEKALFSSNIHSFEHISAYDRLLWEGWIPSLRKAALQWDPRDEMEAMLRIVETWLPVLPDWMKENVLDQIIIPRIVDRVGNWDPLTDVVPIHSWVVPWLAVLGDRLQPVLSPIRQKLAKVLRDRWDPSDTSALAMLKPWRGVWTAGTLSAFLAQNIVPKLEKFLDRMSLNPGEFSERNWAAVMSWEELVNPDTIANVLTKFFFPKWYGVLCTWLEAPGVILPEVKMWFDEWMKRIPPALHEFPTIKENMRRAMIAMHQRAKGLPISSIPVMPQNQPAPPPPPLPLRDLRAPTQQLTVREMVELLAGRHGLTYIPQPGRTRDDKQVFWFGALSIYMDRGMVFVMCPREMVWRPCSMDELLVLANVGV